MARYVIYCKARRALDKTCPALLHTASNLLTEKRDGRKKHLHPVSPKSDQAKGHRMKVRTIIVIAAAAILPTLTALADKYDDLATEGYRWVSTDGPFACTSKDDANRISKDQSDNNTLRMVRNGGVYYLIRGVIVRVVQEDKASGLSLVHWAGITENIWMPSKFLSKRPVTSILGTISTPGQPIGTTPGTNIQLSPIPTPTQTATPTQGEATEAAARPTP